MAKTPNYRLGEFHSFIDTRPLRSSLRFGPRTATEISFLRVGGHLIEKGKRKGTPGIGEVPMVAAWAWPSRTMPPEQTNRVLLGLAAEICTAASEIEFGDHPLRFGMALIRRGEEIAADLATRMKLAEPIPRLAVLMACAAIDAAVHDAFGRQHRRSTYDCLSGEYFSGDLSEFFGEEYAGVPVDAGVSERPKTTLALYHDVGVGDPLTGRDLGRRLDDGRPETLEEWLQAEQLSHLNIKLKGTELDWDVGRVIEIDRIATRFAFSREWSYALDFNEACASEDYVIDFLERVDRLSRSVSERLRFIEQPTTRQMVARRDITMHRVGRLMAVVVDESLTDVESLAVAQQLGYSGVGLRTSKTITLSILLAAAAKSKKMTAYVLDLPTAGASYLTSAALAAHLSAVDAVAGSGRQYCPAANDGWDGVYPPLFQIIGGTIPSELLDQPGLGFKWPAGAPPEGYEDLAK